MLREVLLREAELDCAGQQAGRHGLVDRMEREVRRYRGMAQELARKRPDGLVVNWQKREVFLLEFTRAWDAKPDYRLVVSKRKMALYVQLLARVLARLGATWKGQKLCFTVVVSAQSRFGQQFGGVGGAPKCACLYHESCCDCHS